MKMFSLSPSRVLATIGVTLTILSSSHVDSFLQPKAKTYKISDIVSTSTSSSSYHPQQIVSKSKLILEAQKSTDETNDNTNEKGIPPPPPSSSSSSETNANPTDNIDKITAEAELAIKEAQEALDQVDNDNTISNEIEMARKKAQEAQLQAARITQEKEMAKKQIEAAVTGLGGFLFGIVSGGVTDIFLKANNLDVDIDLIIPPTVFALVFATTGATLGQNDDDLGNLVRSVFGGPLKAVTNAVTTAVVNKIEETVDDIKATPGRIQNAVEQKVQETTDEIKAIPTKVKDNIEASVEKTVDEIKAIPVKAKDAATEAVEKAKDDITDATIRTVEEIKATPGRVVEETKQAIVKTVEDVEDKVEQAVSDTVGSIKKNVDEVTSLPAKTIDQISGTVASALPTDNKTTSTSSAVTEKDDIVPRPPDLPPPPSLMEKLTSDKKVDTKPKVQSQPKPKSKEPPKKESDNFVFSEVSLKSFVDGAKSRTETSKVDESSSKAEENRRKREIDQKRKLELEQKQAAAKQRELEKKALAEEKQRQLEEKQAAEAAAKQRELEKKALAEEKKRELEEQRAIAAAEKKRELEAKKAAQEEQQKQLEEQKRQNALEQAAAKKRASEERQKVQAAKKSVTKAKPGATISLGLFNFGGQSDDTTTTPKTSKAPRGVPTLTRWRKNRDGSLSGAILGSKTFRDGDNVTTSPIKGPATDGNVVTTISGSKYFLDSKASTATRTPVRKANQNSQKARKDAQAAKIKAEAEQKRLAEKEAIEAKRREEIEQKKQEAENARREAEEKRKQIAEQRKADAAAAAEARKQAAEQRKAEAAAAAEARKKAAEQRKAEATAAAEAKRKETEQKRETQSQEKQVKQALGGAKKGATISLGFFNFGQQSVEEGTADIEATKASNAPSGAPRGVPTLSKWNQNRDGSITGEISGSNAYNDGEAVTTSTIIGNAAEGSVVQTKSGSKYYLGPKAGVGGFFGFGAPAATKTASISSAADDSKQKAQEAAAAKRKEAAEKRRQKAIADKEAAEAKRKEDIEKKKQAEAKRKQAAAEKKQQAEAAAEARKQAAEQRQAKAAAAAEAKRKDAEEKRKTQDQEKQVKQALGGAKKGATVSLGFFNFGQKSDEEEKDETITIKTKSGAPRGVPTLSKWSQNRDGSITGEISGSKAYDDGETITTSGIAGEVTEGSIIQTRSGSRYFLGSKAGAGGFFGFGTSKPKTVETTAKVTTKTTASPNARRNEAQAKKEASTTPTQSSRTFSIGLFNFGQDDAQEESPSTSSNAPKGVPVLSKWKQNGDGSISGNISGSPSFKRGEFVTTSPISGKAVGGAVVRTSSGSRYFLDSNSSISAPVRPNAQKNKAAEQKKEREAALAQTRKRLEVEKKAKAAALAEERKRAADEKKAKTAAVAEERKRAANEKKAKIQAEQAKKAKESVENAKPRSTISLGFFNFGQSDDEEDVATNVSSIPKTNARKVASAPRGVPTIYKWRQNRDGSISGVIFGSKAFEEGESVTTSPISSDAVESAVVQTLSGSRYFLASKNASIPTQKQAAPKKTPPPKVKKQARKAAPKAAPKATPKANQRKSGSATITLSKPVAPKGIPTLKNWKRNGDSSISGFISGSSKFSDGAKITTSPITKGNVRAGEVVKTGSGSSYFLS